MDFYDVLKNRRSFRGYSDQTIPEDSLQRIMQAVQCAPSACNRQPWRFEIVFNAGLRQRIGECYPKTWLLEAPAIVVAMADYSTCWNRLEGTPAAELDLGIAMEHLVLAAAAENLGTCWICAFDVPAMAKVFDLPANLTPYVLLALGYPAEDAAPGPRHFQRVPLEETVKFL